MKILILLAMVGSLIGCSSLKSYQKVADDKYRNSAERALLSKACAEEFKEIKDTPRVVYSGVDSSDYIAVAQSYNALVDSLIAHNERDTATTSERVIYKFRITDSLRIIKDFLRTYHPPAIIKTEVKEVPVRNTAVENNLQTTIYNCRNENTELIAQAASAKEDRKKAKTTNVWLYIIGGLLLFGNGYQLFSKKKLLV